MDYYFTINISRDEYLRYYQGTARNVRMTLTNGSSVQFPADNLRNFVTAEGVQGRFHMRTDANNKLILFERVG